ncbi:hypothetical protein Ocin01_00366 [Orchesella cincta]|uniref:Uncharacterized protein n=1 Tax=Orchesella cincta TaxID=48709 RepID=A0A1D2NMH6_ORCCI|nr:hypothetical protein Ocin01_00366 [Orchesella cincta]
MRNTWASEEPTSAISLNKHRVSKKSHFTPELFLRDAAISSRTQPDPLYMRKLLARISSSRRPPRSRAESDAIPIGYLLWDNCWSIPPGSMMALWSIDLFCK